MFLWFSDPVEFEITVYSSGYNLEQGIAYYTCYDNHQISAVDMHKTDLDSAELVSFPMINTEQIMSVVDDAIFMRHLDAVKQ